MIVQEPFPLTSLVSLTEPSPITQPILPPPPDRQVVQRSRR